MADPIKTKRERFEESYLKSQRVQGIKQFFETNPINFDDHFLTRYMLEEIKPICMEEIDKILKRQQEMNDKQYEKLNKTNPDILWKTGDGRQLTVKEMSTEHIANSLNYLVSNKYLNLRQHQVIALIEEFETRTDVSPRDFDKFAQAYEVIEVMRDESMTQTYNIRIQSPFILTAKDVKQKIGIGYKVITVEVEKDLPQIEFKNVDETVEAMVKTGYKALMRAHHPDLGGDPEKAVLLNRAKKELLDLLQLVKEKK